MVPKWYSPTFTLSLGWLRDAPLAVLQLPEGGREGGAWGIFMCGAFPGFPFNTCGLAIFWEGLKASPGYRRDLGLKGSSPHVTMQSEIPS